MWSTQHSPIKRTTNFTTCNRNVTNLVLQHSCHSLSSLVGRWDQRLAKRTCEREVPLLAIKWEKYYFYFSYHPKQSRVFNSCFHYSNCVSISARNEVQNPLDSQSCLNWNRYSRRLSGKSSIHLSLMSKNVRGNE